MAAIAFPFKRARSIKRIRARLLSWLSRRGLMNISRRIGALVALFAGFLLVGFALVRWGYGLIETEVGRIQQAQEVTVLTSQVQLQVTAAKGHEGAFLAQPTEEDVEEYKAHLKQAIQKTEQLKTHQLSPEFAAATAQLGEMLQDYGEGFESVVDYNRSMGFSMNQGFRERFASSAQEMQSQFEALGRDDLVLRLMSIRAAEKDFFLGRLSAGREVREQMNNLRGDLQKVRGAQGLVAPAGVIDGYLSNFDRIKLYTYKVNDIEASFREEFEEIPELLAKLDQIALSEQIIVGNKAQEVMASLAERFLLLGLATLAFVTLFGWALSRSILRPIKEVSDLTDQLTQGNLSVRLKNQGIDELGKMSKRLNRFAGSLSKTIAVIHQGSDTLSAASGELAATTRQIEHTTQEANRSSEESNQSIQEVSRNVEDLAVSNEEITDSLRQLMATADQVSAEADRGQGTMQRASDAVGQIVSGQKRIEGVLESIEKISKRVHLLSFNAAIEAAKAGEAGRGFNVVAAEIRKLAEHTHQALNDIGEVIEATRSDVQQGKSVLSEANQQFATIVSDVGEITKGLNRIGGALVAQDYKTKSLARETEKISRLSERNSQVMFELAATVREVDGTTGNLSGMAGALRAQVLVFKI